MLTTWGWPSDDGSQQLIDIVTLEGLYTNWQYDKDTDFFEQTFPINKPTFIRGMKMICMYAGYSNKECAGVFGGTNLHKALKSEWETLAAGSKTVAIKQVNEGPLKKVQEAAMWSDFGANYFDLRANDVKIGLKALLGSGKKVVEAFTASDGVLAAEGLL